MGCFTFSDTITGPRRSGRGWTGSHAIFSVHPWGSTGGAQREGAALPELIVCDLFQPDSMRRFRHALHGLVFAFRRREVAQHLVFALVAVVVGLLLCLDGLEWALIALSIGLVLTAETANSALEDLADTLSPAQSSGIRQVKDFSAAAVLLAAFTSLAVGIAVFGGAARTLAERSCLL